MPLDPQRVSQLHAIKLKSLVASTLGEDHAQALGQITGTDSGAFAVRDLGNSDSNLASESADGASAVYLDEQQPATALGPALATAARAGASELHVFASDMTATLVRRAALFDFPITVWAVEGNKATLAETTQGRAVESPPPRVPELVALLREAGADVSVEHGVITGEVQGLEIARISPTVLPDPATSLAPVTSPDPAVPRGADLATPAGPATSLDPAVPRGADLAASLDPAVPRGADLATPAGPATPADLATPSDQSDQQYRIEVGVGAHDREAFGMLHANEPTIESVRRIAELIRRHRSPGAEPHPFNRMAAARWLRAILQERPELVGAKRLTAAVPPVARTGVTDKAPAVSYGVDESDRQLVVVTSVGIDLDLVPFAADARAFLDDSAQLVIAVPQRDNHPLLGQLIAWLKPTGQPTDQTSDQQTSVQASATLVPLPNDWQTSLGTA